jgi:hypothetical protein
MSSLLELLVMEPLLELKSYGSKWIFVFPNHTKESKVSWNELEQTLHMLLHKRNSLSYSSSQLKTNIQFLNEQHMLRITNDLRRPLLT